jgi:hypothetical protein
VGGIGGFGNGGSGGEGGSGSGTGGGSGSGRALEDIDMSLPLVLCRICFMLARVQLTHRKLGTNVTADVQHPRTIRTARILSPKNRNSSETFVAGAIRAFYSIVPRLVHDDGPFLAALT